MSSDLTKEKIITLSHFTKHPLGELRLVKQEFKGDYRSCYDKPRGLWVSVDGEDDWQNWCKSSMPDWIEGTIRYRVLLAADPHLLVMSKPSDLDRFMVEYSRPQSHHRDRYIDWPSVAEKYNGIIIAPYQWPCRMEMSWYYGWDCASGCIWNPDAIASVIELRAAA